MNPLRLFLLLAVAAFPGALWPASVSAQSADALFYERALLAEADRRCDLFESPVSAALLASSGQARGAALRATSPAAVRAVQGRALARAARTPCASPELQTAAGRVRVAYQGWSQLRHMTFPGRRAAWRADRTVSEGARWRLAQTTRLGDQAALFGLASEGREPPRLTAVARLRERPAYVRLSLPNGKAFLAEGRRPAPKALQPRGWGEPLAFRFSTAAAAALAQLDPATVVKLEFVSPTRSGEKARSARIEVGDFAAGQAFVALGAPLRP